MKVQGANASVEKTKKQIRQAFLEMHNERIAGDKMTIKDLSKRAGISRSTFYTHYSDLYEVGEELVSEALQNIFAEDSKDVIQLFERLFRYLQENEEYCRMLLKSDYPVAFFQQLGGHLKNKVKNMEHNSKDQYWNIRTSVIIDGIIQQLIGYFQNEQVCSMREFCDGLMDVCKRMK